MNKRIFFVVIVIILISTNCFAQQKSTIKTFQFHSINNVGLLEGQAGSAFQLQTINGFQHKSWFAGIGVGLDYYRYRTIPLFVDLRKEFGEKKNKFFVYGDAGISFSWVTDKQKMLYATNDKFKNGFYGDAGAGYKISVSKNNSLLLSLGYTFKKVEETNNTYFLTPGWPIISSEKYDYGLNRLSIKIGWEF